MALAMSNERSDAHNSVVDVLGELIAEDCSNVCIRLADKVIGCSEPTQIGHSF